MWNSGPLPDVARDLPGAAVPVRVRAEVANSLNNRFRPDPLLRTRAVLQLDDDTLIRYEDHARVSDAVLSCSIVMHACAVKYESGEEMQHESSMPPPGLGATFGRQARQARPG